MNPAVNFLPTGQFWTFISRDLHEGNQRWSHRAFPKLHIGLTVKRKKKYHTGRRSRLREAADTISCNTPHGRLDARRLEAGVNRTKSRLRESKIRNSFHAGEK